jgi:RimJ/RimL family protein N-acetyltransferase
LERTRRRRSGIINARCAAPLNITLCGILKRKWQNNSTNVLRLLKRCDFGSLYCCRAKIRALIAGDIDQAFEHAGALFPPGWPESNEAREGLPWHLQRLESSEHHRAWRIRVVERATDRVVGSVNLKGPPDAEGDVEIGCGITEARRRRGYALKLPTADVQPQT